MLTVGAQINAKNFAGVHQIVFGIATEAWAEPGSRSMLYGIEATTINREPDNPYRKVSMWSTFKNRTDTDYYNVPADPMNINSQALRIESQIGTGFERGVVFAPISLHVSPTMARPAAIDLSELAADADRRGRPDQDSHRRVAALRPADARAVSVPRAGLSAGCAAHGGRAVPRPPCAGARSARCRRGCRVGCRERELFGAAMRYW